MQEYKEYVTTTDWYMAATCYYEIMLPYLGLTLTPKNLASMRSAVYDCQRHQRLIDKSAVWEIPFNLVPNPGRGTVTIEPDLANSKVGIVDFNTNQKPNNTFVALNIVV